MKFDNLNKKFDVGGQTIIKFSNTKKKSVNLPN